MSAPPMRLAFVGSYPPTACGIATFTESLRRAVSESETAEEAQEDRPGIVADVIRLVERPSTSRVDGVVAEWVSGDASSLRRAIEFADTYDCVVLQHEFGIYGGDDGESVVEFISALSVPVVVVLHTVVPAPTPKQRRIIERIVAEADATVVQTESARARLLARHDVDRDRVWVIPHGATANFDGPAADLAVSQGPVMLTWGLLGPGKGIEHAIRALAILRNRGSLVPTYLVAGRTHPNVVASQGERYRTHLRDLADELGVGDRVVFDDSYRDWGSLRAMVREADVVVLPYDSRDQVTSGVLVEALASAAPVVATAFPHAVEALEGGAGLVVPHEDPEAIADGVEAILGDSGLRDSMRTVARTESSGLLWPQIGARYLALAKQCVSPRKLIVA